MTLESFGRYPNLAIEMRTVHGRLLKLKPCAPGEFIHAPIPHGRLLGVEAMSDGRVRTRSNPLCLRPVREKLFSKMILRYDKAKIIIFLTTTSKKSRQIRDGKGFHMTSIFIFFFDMIAY